MKRIQRAGICLALFCALLPSACQSSRPASVEVSGETVSKVQEKEPSAEGVVSSEPSADTSLPPVPEISSEQESAPESTPASEPESASVPEPVSEEVSEPAPVPLPDEPDEVTEELLLCKDQKHGYSTNEQGLPEGTRIYLDRNIKAGYVVLYDAEKDEILYSKDGEKKIYPASTTKMLTAITAWKVIHDKDYVITVGDEIHLIDPYSSVAGLEEGMQLTLEMMMDAMLMPSGNDAAYVLAVNCGRIYRRRMDATFCARTAAESTGEIRSCRQKRRSGSLWNWKTVLRTGSAPKTRILSPLTVFMTKITIPRRWI